MDKPLAYATQALRISFLNIAQELPVLLSLYRYEPSDGIVFLQAQREAGQ